MLSWQTKSFRPWLKGIAFFTCLIFTSQSLGWSEGVRNTFSASEHAPSENALIKKTSLLGTILATGLPSASGQIKRSVFFENGLRKGEDHIWSEKGLLLDYGNYKEGRPQGKQQKYYSNGVLKEEIIHQDDGKMDRFVWNEKGEFLREDKDLK